MRTDNWCFGKSFHLVELQTLGFNLRAQLQRQKHVRKKCFLNDHFIAIVLLPLFNEHGIMTVLLPCRRHVSHAG